MPVSAYAIAQFIADGELIVRRLRDGGESPELIARAERAISQAKDELAIRVLSG